MTISTIILIAVSVYLLFVATMVRVPDTLLNKFVLKFIPLLLAFILMLCVFKGVEASLHNKEYSNIINSR